MSSKSVALHTIGNTTSIRLFILSFYLRMRTSEYCWSNEWMDSSKQFSVRNKYYYERRIDLSDDYVKNVLIVSG